MAAMLASPAPGFHYKCTGPPEERYLREISRNQCELFVTQSYHGIDTRRAKRGDVTGRERDERKQ